ncbi:Protein single-minded [Gryllus bimaculatus]|nr:Protein single-minded [Gryllus bimaculatus]
MISGAGCSSRRVSPAGRCTMKDLARKDRSDMKTLGAGRRARVRYERRSRRRGVFHEPSAPGRRAAVRGGERGRRLQRLGPCDLQDPVWVKMSAAVAGGVNKKRKKSDTKPQAQLTKCLNEKKRREQENIYIEELAELISASLADMSTISVKPDKCAILQETVNQIRNIKQQEGISCDAVQQGEVSSTKHTLLGSEVFGNLLLEALEGFLFVVNKEASVEYVSDNVYQFIKHKKDEVLGQSIYNFIHLGDTTRFSAILLPLTSTGWTTEPVVARNRSVTCRLLIKEENEERETMEEKQQRVTKYETMQISSILLSSDKTEGGDVSSESAEMTHCLCVARRIPSAEKASCLTSVDHLTMRLDPSGHIVGVDTSGMTPTYHSYFNKELEGRSIRDVVHQQDLPKLTTHLKEVLQSGHGTSLVYRLKSLKNPEKYVQVQTRSKLYDCDNEPNFIMAVHSIIAETESAPADCGHLPNSPRSMLTVGQSNSTSASSFGSTSSANGSNNSLGGPLVSGSVNGQTSATSSSSGRSSVGGVSSSSFGPSAVNDISNTIALNSSSTYPTFGLSSSDLSLNDFDLFPSSTFDLADSGGENSLDQMTGQTGTGSSGWERPSSRQSLTPVSTPTPRPPSGAGPYSPAQAGGVCASPLNPYSSAMQPSPASSAQASTPASRYAYSFSPLQEQGPNSAYGLDDNKDSKEGAGELGNSASGGVNGSVEGGSSTTGESERLRMLLLTTKRPSVSGDDSCISDSMDPSVDNSEARNKHRILKNLLNPDEEDDSRRVEDSSTLQASPSSRTSQLSNRLSQDSHNKVSTGNNNMLLRLLNEKSDDDDLEIKAGIKKRNELLQQLLKDQDEEKPQMALDTGQQQQFQQHQHHQHGEPEDPLLLSLGFPNTSSPSPPSNTDSLGGLSSLIGGRKRPSNEGEDSNCPTKIRASVPSMVPHSNPPVSSSSGNSKLREKNKMLASLLAQQPSLPATIPPIPASVISATPQEHLPPPRVERPNLTRSESTFEVLVWGWCTTAYNKCVNHKAIATRSQQVKCTTSWPSKTSS